MNNYKVIIIGTGPAGLCAALELIKLGVPGSDIVMLESGPDVSRRIQVRKKGKDEYSTTGLGGAGLFSDGKLAYFRKEWPLFPDDKEIVGMWEALPNNDITEEETLELYRYAFDIYAEQGITIKKGDILTDEIKKLRNKFKKVDVHFEYYESRQIAAEDLPVLISRMYEKLQLAGVTILFDSHVTTLIHQSDGTKSISTSKEEYNCEKLIIAVGKRGMRWLIKKAKSLHIQTIFRPIAIGVRVEVPKEVMDPFTKVHRDIQLIKKIDKNTTVQTFCTCSGGIVSKCDYEDNLFVLGGYTSETLTKNTNFALLVKQNLPDIDAFEYGQSIIRTANILGNGEPVVQLLGDLKMNRSTSKKDLEKNPVKTTLSSYTPGNISQAFPKKVITSLLATLEAFGKVMRGVNNDSTIVSAPCLEFCYHKVVVSKTMETNIPGIYVAGDVSGYESGIIPASASGILAARGIKPTLS